MHLKLIDYQSTIEYGNRTRITINWTKELNL